MPQPSFAGTPVTVTFGGLALPNGQGTMTNLNLNDVTSWFLQDWQANLVKQITKGQQVWRSKGVVLGRDFPGFSITLPMKYREASPGALGAALAQLAQAGEQQLSFDGSTFILAEFETTASRQLWIKWGNYWWNLNLQFWCRVPWFQDLSATNLTTVNIVNAPATAPTGSTASGGALATGTYTLAYTYVTASGETAASPASSNIVLTTGNQQISVSAVTPLPAFATAVRWYFLSGPTTGFTVQNSGGAFTLNTAGNSAAAPASTPATNFSITYAGSIFAEPTFTLTVPNTNAAVIGNLVLTNTMSSEALTATLNLAASTAYTVTVSGANFAVTDGSGHSYDIAGSFPMLYGPAGQANTFTVAVTAVSGVPTGLTLGGTYSNRWVL